MTTDEKVFRLTAEAAHRAGFGEPLPPGQLTKEQICDAAKAIAAYVRHLNGLPDPGLVRRRGFWSRLLRRRTLTPTPPSDSKEV